jgi:hypothetical protein
MQALSQLSYTPESGTQSEYQILAEWTGLEPATPGVTGRYSNQLNYHSALVAAFPEYVSIFPQAQPNLASPRGFEPLLQP